MNPLTFSVGGQTPYQTSTQTSTQAVGGSAPMVFPGAGATPQNPNPAYQIASTPTSTTIPTVPTAPSGGLGSYKGVTINPGSQAQIQAQMAQIDGNGVSPASLGYQAPTKLTPSPYSVPVSNTYPSNYTSGTSNASTLNTAYQDKVQGMNSGTNTSSYPSDSYASTLSALTAARQFSPEQITNLQNISDINTKIAATNLAARRQIQQLQENGDITKEQASGFLTEAQRRSDAQLANLSVAQTADNNQLNVLGLIQQNQIGALTGQLSAFAPTMALSPGQTAINPLGQSVAGAPGVAPQITTLATQLYSQALSTGNVITDANGQPNMAAYMQQAAQLTGIPLPAGSGASMGYSTQSMGGQTYQGNTQQLTPGQSTVASYGSNGQVSQVPYQGQAEGQAVGYGSNGYGNVSALPSTIQKYVQYSTVSDAQGNITNLPYVNADRLPDALKATAQANAAAAGVPFLSGTAINAVNAAQQIIDVVNQAEALAQRNLASGVTGRITNTLTNFANNWLQFNPDLTNFSQLKDAASKSTTALAGGVGSGFRMNQAVIDNAVNNMPTANDNLETAMTKAEALRGQIMNAIAPLYPQLGGQSIFSGNYTSSNPTGTASSPTGGSGWSSLGD